MAGKVDLCALIALCYTKKYNNLITDKNKDKDDYLAVSAPLPPRVLVIYAHPEPQNSIANQVMIKKIQSLDHVTVRDLYGAYPDFFY